VEIRVEAADGCFRLKVNDDGCGIAPERLERPATLRALRQRAEALRAKFEVDSRPEAGTRLRLEIPLSSARKPGR
jgi:signal transduction histidine kinase